MHNRALRYIDAVARHGSIRAAAEAVNVAPSAINRYVLELEADLGVPLFERLPRGMRPTAAGEILLMHIRGTLREYERAVSEIGQLKTGTRGQVTIASVASPLWGLLPAAIDSFAQRYPRVEFYVREFDMDQCVREVVEDRADLCLIFNPPPRLSLRQVAGADFPLGVIAAPDHPIAQRKTAKLDHLLGYELVLPDGSTSIAREIDHVLETRDLRLKAQFMSSSVAYMIAHAARGAALGIMTPVGIEDYLRDGRLVFLPLTDHGIRAQRLIAGSADAAVSVAAANFSRHLRGHLQAWAETGDLPD